MLEAAQRQPATAAEVGEIRGIERRQLERYGDKLLALISEGRQVAESDWIREPRRPKLDGRQKSLLAALEKMLEEFADNESINAGIVASRRNLAAVVIDLSADSINGWRKGIIEVLFKKAMDSVQA